MLLLRFMPEAGKDGIPSHSGVIFQIEYGLVFLALSSFGELLLLRYWLGMGFAWRWRPWWKNSADEVAFEAIGLEDGFAWDDCSGYRIGDDRACFVG